MSYLAFNTREREVHVRGWERHRLPGIVRDFGTGMLALHAASTGLERLDALTPAGTAAKYVNREPGWGRDMAEHFRLYLGHEDFLSYQGHVIESWPLLLNTVLELGSDPFRLAARFAGQYYGHCWIPGPDRGWAADLITAGLVSDVFRHKIKVTDPSPIIPNVSVETEHHTGWTDVIELLRETDKGSVVLSVSTDDDFPNSGSLGIPYDDYEEILSEPNGNDQIWDLAEIWLKNRHTGHRIDQATFGEFRFDHRLSAWDLTATDYEDRLDRSITEKRI